MHKYCSRYKSSRCAFFLEGALLNLSVMASSSATAIGLDVTERTFNLEESSESGELLTENVSHLKGG